MILAAVAATLLWQPARLSPTRATTETMLAAYRRDVVPFRERVSRLHVVEGPDAFDAIALQRGSDYRIDLTLGGAAYAFGRDEGVRWRRTPAGTVRVIASDVQGDALDRWPSAVFGFDQNACAPDGETRDGNDLRWVLACRAAGDAPHWFFIDAASGAIVREVAREGVHVVTYTFDANGWTVDGFGGKATVTSVADGARAVAERDVAIPASRGDVFALPDGAATPVRAFFGPDDVAVPVTIDGQPSEFVLDTGTTQILIDPRVAARAHLRTTLGHAIVRRLAIGALTGHDVPVQVVDLFGGAMGGILGNEFFTGHIVHLDYAKRRLELLDRASFVPPPGAPAMAVDFGEGMPLVEAQVNATDGERFALDTGSTEVLLNAPFAHIAGVDGRSALTVEQFLEGPIDVTHGSADALRFGPVAFEHLRVGAVRPSASNLDIPLDGIIGTDELRYFEWWFDYDGGRLWLRRT